MSSQSNLSKLQLFESQEANLFEALQFFDSLPEVSIEKMAGTWTGSTLYTGHPMDGMLERFGWYGKEFVDSENVQPLLFRDLRGEPFPFFPGLIPFDFALRHIHFFNSPLVGKVFRLVCRIGKASRPGARLRMTQYRGRLSATMVYDNLAINDIFRLVDDHTLLGAMDMRRENPFFFVLRRKI